MDANRLLVHSFFADNVTKKEPEKVISGPH